MGVKRRLAFVVDGQTLRKDPSCNFDGIVSGTHGYLYATFDFSREWDGCKVAASFFHNGEEHAEPVINGHCNVPDEVLDGRLFKVKLIGVRKGYRITTTTCSVKQEVI